MKQYKTSITIDFELDRVVTKKIQKNLMDNVNAALIAHFGVGCLKGFDVACSDHAHTYNYSLRENRKR